MIAAIWSFALGWVALFWGVASIFLPLRLIRTPNGMELDSSGAMIAITPVAVVTLAVAGLSWYAVKHAKAPPEWKVGVSRGLGSSGFALSLIGLVIAISFSPIW